MTALITAEYNGVPFTFQSNGWFHASAAAKRYGKECYEWLRSPETVRYLAALARRYGKIPYVKTSRARADRGGGTWLHPKLAVMFARWLDVDFELWCDEQIERLVHGHLMQRVPDDELTTVRDRIPLLMVAVNALDRHGLSLTITYRALNAAAGSDSFGHMTHRELAKIKPAVTRINTDRDTQDDWSMLHIGGKAQQGSAQLEFAFGAPALYKPEESWYR